MSWAVFDTIAAENAEFSDVFSRIRDVIEKAGYDPVLDPEMISGYLHVDVGEVEFAFDRLVEGGFLRVVVVSLCTMCSIDLTEDKLSADLNGYITCRCGNTFTEPKQATRYMIVDPGTFEPIDALVARARLGVITALPKEAAAFRTMLDGVTTIVRTTRERARTYDVGTVPALGGGTHAVVHLMLGDMGNNVAANRATALLEHFPSVENIIMVGIAGGVPNPSKVDQHVRLGDIVVSDRSGVIQYDFVKEEQERVVERFRPVAPAAQLLDAVSRIRMLEAEGIRPWSDQLSRGVHLPLASRPPAEADELIDATTGEVVEHPVDQARVPERPRVFYGPIASSNTLLKNAAKRDDLRDRFNVKAVEMEGSGIADATWDFRAGYLVVRGICDYCDRAKGDAWQEYAALAAAAYTRALLMNLPPLA